MQHIYHHQSRVIEFKGAVVSVNPTTKHCSFMSEVTTICDTHTTPTCMDVSASCC